MGLSYSNEKTLIRVIIGAYFTLANVISYASGGSKYAKYVLLFLLVLALGLCILEKQGKIEFRITGFHVYLIVFSTYATMSSIWAVNSNMALSRGIDMIEITVSMVIILLCFQDDESLDPIFKVIMWGGYAVCLYSVLYYGPSYYIGILTNSIRISNDSVNANVLGMRAAYSISISVYYFLKQEYSVISISMIPIALIIIGASGSRKAILVLVLCVSSLFLCHSIVPHDPIKTLLKWLLTIAILIILVFCASKLPIFKVVIERIGEMINGLQGSEDADHSTMMRMEMLNLGKRLFLKSPLIGVGFENTYIYASQELGVFSYLHNNYIEVLASGGILGFLLYYSIFIYCLVLLLVYRDFQNMEFNLVLIVLITFLIMDFGCVSYSSKSTYFYIMLFYKGTQKMRIASSKSEICNSKICKTIRQ